MNLIIEVTITLEGQIILLVVATFLVYIIAKRIGGTGCGCCATTLPTEQIVRFLIPFLFGTNGFNTLSEFGFC